MPDNKLIEYASATELARLIRSRRVSCHEVTANTLDRIADVNPQVNAIVTLAPDALSHAREADQALSRGESWGPLHGVPCTVKDTFEARGLRTTAGAEELRDYTPAEDSTVVSRLRAAGAILLGKTNTPRMAVDWQTYNSIFGVTNNPYNSKLTPGGSSGGCAAAVCAGLSYLSVGSDMGGSIRIPAAFCGVYGHRPSAGVIPSKGNIPPMPGKHSAGNGLGVRGPLARNPADLKLALEVLGGPASAEAVAWRWSLPAARCARISDYRIGFAFEQAAYPLSAEVWTALDGVVEALRKSGAEVEEGWPKGLKPERHFEAFRVLSLNRKAAHSGKSPDALRREAAFGARAHRWESLTMNLGTAKAIGAEAREIWREYFRAHDAFLLPVAMVGAFAHDHSEPIEDRWLQTSEGPQPYLNLPFWVSFATLAGLPATSAPTGSSDSRTPVGVQIVGPYLEDATPIDLAGRLADLVGGFRPPEVHPKEAPVAASPETARRELPE